MTDEGGLFLRQRSCTDTTTLTSYSSQKRLVVCRRVDGLNNYRLSRVPITTDFSHTEDRSVRLSLQGPRSVDGITAVLILRGDGTTFGVSNLHSRKRLFGKLCTRQHHP